MAKKPTHSTEFPSRDFLMPGNSPEPFDVVPDVLNKNLEMILVSVAVFFAGGASQIKLPRLAHDHREEHWILQY